MDKLTPIQTETRAKMITLAYNRGLSLQEISDLFSSGLSKSRVWQIYIANNKKTLKK